MDYQTGTKFTVSLSTKRLSTLPYESGAECDMPGVAAPPRELRSPQTRVIGATDSASDDDAKFPIKGQGRLLLRIRYLVRCTPLCLAKIWSECVVSVQRNPALVCDWESQVVAGRQLWRDAS